MEILFWDSPKVECFAGRSWGKQVWVDSIDNNLYRGTDINPADFLKRRAQREE